MAFPLIKGHPSIFTASQNKLQYDGNQLDAYPTEDAATQDIERCKKEDMMLELANLAVIPVVIHVDIRLLESACFCLS